MVSYLFAGQGSQYLGMGKSLYENFECAKKIFLSADEVLGFKLSELCFSGPEEELSRTINSQPAILTVSICSFEVFKTLFPSYQEKVKFAAGLSLGEYSALVASETLDFKDALLLVRKRAEFMEEVGKKEKAGMLAILGLNLEEAKEICSISGAEIANINCPGQIVIAGRLESIKKAEDLARERKAKVIPLKVNIASHSSLMKEAKLKLEEEIKKINFNIPRIPIVSNVDAKPTLEPEAIKEKLIQQMTSPVLWQDTINFMLSSGIKKFFEFGPGRVLAGLLRKIEPKAEIFSLEKKEDFEVIKS